MNHDWKEDGVDTHKGEYWYRCSRCGAQDWIARYGTTDQLTRTVCVGNINQELNMSKITAAEARVLSGPTVQDRVDEVYPKIRKAAEEKKREVHLHGWWADNGYYTKNVWTEACDILRKDGYTVEFFYEERQFVDMYTVVKW